MSVDEVIRTSVQARAFEDNQSALYLATNQRITNRTKYFLTKWHWFWQLTPKEFTCHKVGTEKQLADFLTKGLVLQLFLNNRRRVQGW